MITTATRQRPAQTAVAYPDLKENHNVTNTCQICGAGYAPADTHQYLLYAPPIIQEAALMSLCHYCFRCRRPSCPECWDTIHSICAACVEEVHLPFRADVSPFKGLKYPLPPQLPIPAQETNNASSQLVCVRPGRFQPSAPIETPKAATREPAQLSPTREPEEPAPISSKVIPEEPAHISPIQEIWTYVDNQEPAQQEEQEEVFTDQDDTPKKTGLHLIKVIERTLTVIAFLNLLAIVVLIILAESVPSANAQIIHFLHIDIRSEIAYLIHLMQQLHW